MSEQMNDPGDDLFAHGGEEPLEGFDGSFLAHPEQTGDANIDLIDQGQVFVAFGVLNFIDADGVDRAERAVLQSPSDDMLDRVADLFPRGTKGLGSFFPRKAAGPAGQEEHVGSGQGAFAVAPRNFFNHDGPAAAAIHSPHGVQEEDEKAPQRDELKTAFGELVVPGRGLMTARTDRGGTLAWPYKDLDALVVGTEACPMIDKSPEAVAAV
jgi:hypothetical protein